MKRTRLPVNVVGGGFFSALDYANTILANKTFRSSLEPMLASRAVEVQSNSTKHATETNLIRCTSSPVKSAATVPCPWFEAALDSRLVHFAFVHFPHY